MNRPEIPPTKDSSTAEGPEKGQETKALHLAVAAQLKEFLAKLNNPDGQQKA
ncbi:MAG: hypothetical protein V1936_01915 [Patescibacteria group bacterium]